MKTDYRNIKNGLEIPTASYSDQPYIVKTDDGAWLCCVTTGSGHEGASGQHIITMRSSDYGNNWSSPVPIEKSKNVGNSYAAMLKVPSGRIYIFYNHNSDNIRTVKCHNGGEFTRVDSLGYYVFKYSDAYRLHGFQNFLMNIALKPELIKTLINKLTDVYLELNQTYFEVLNGKMDVWFFGNDFGSQNDLLFSRDMWYEFFFENIKRLTNLAHSYGLKVMMHSCGGISEIIPDLIEAGVDILDPIQVTAKGMESQSLADKFGGKIVFHGGIDTQQVLPNSTPNEVAVHARKIEQTLNKAGGYIFAPSQILASDIPVENIVAMYEEINK